MKHIEVFTIAGVNWTELVKAGRVPTPAADSERIKMFLEKHYDELSKITRASVATADGLQTNSVKTELDYALHESEFSEEAISLFIERFRTANARGLAAVISSIVSARVDACNVQAFALDNGTYIGVRAETVFPWQKAPKRIANLEEELEAALKATISDLGIPEDSVIFGQFCDYLEW